LAQKPKSHVTDTTFKVKRWRYSRLTSTCRGRGHCDSLPHSLLYAAG